MTPTRLTLPPDVAHALELLMESIRDEQRALDDWDGTIPKAVQQSTLGRALRWRKSCAASFSDVLAAWVTRELPTPVTDNDP